MDLFRQNNYLSAAKSMLNSEETWDQRPWEKTFPNQADHIESPL